jgi:precorrin-6B methylase 2
MKQSSVRRSAFLHPASRYGGRSHLLRLTAIPLLLLLVTGSVVSRAQEPVQPTIGQPGKDVVWVPTPLELVEKMLDMAEVTPQDVVMDLGSGDGRNIIAAARRGARAVGIEYNPELVAHSERLAREAGVENRAQFVQADMFEADISGATVLALFLLPDNLEKLRDKFLRLRPGSRIVINTFAIPEWEADAIEQVGGQCASWCTSLLYIVPAQVAGTWTLPQGELMLTQQFQKISGALSSGGQRQPVTSGKLRGNEITFTVAGTEYTGTVGGDRIEGVAVVNGRGHTWTATRSH